MIGCFGFLLHRRDAPEVLALAVSIGRDSTDQS